MTLVRTQSTRKEERAARTVARYATRVTALSPRENYEPGIDTVAYRRWNDPALALAWLGGCVGAVAVTVLGTTSGIFALGLIPRLGMTWDGLAAASAWSITPLAAVFGTGVALGAKPRRLRRHVWITLRAWLNERYGIELAPNYGYREILLNKILGSDSWAAGEHTVFKDTSGKEFRLHYSREGCWVEEVSAEIYVPNDYQPAGTPAALVARSAGADESLLIDRLPREAAVLHARGQELLDVAEKRLLSVENEHVVRRVREDYNRLLNLNGELHLLGELAKTDTDALVRAMVALNVELESVLAQERASLSTALHTQLGYIENRSLVGESPLTLPKIEEQHRSALGRPSLV